MDFNKTISKTGIYTLVPEVSSDPIEALLESIEGEKVAMEPISNEEIENTLEEAPIKTVPVVLRGYEFRKWLGKSYLMWSVRYVLESIGIWMKPVATVVHIELPINPLKEPKNWDEKRVKEEQVSLLNKIPKSTSYMVQSVVIRKHMLWKFKKDGVKNVRDPFIQIELAFPGVARTSQEHLEIKAFVERIYKELK